MAPSSDGPGPFNIGTGSSTNSDTQNLFDDESNDDGYKRHSTSSSISPIDGFFSSDSLSGANLNSIGLNYINSILGSGIVGIPYALHKAGFGFGLFLLLALAFITDYSLSLLVKSANLAGVTSYQDLVHVAFGRPGYYLLTFLQFIFPFISMIAYNVIIGDTVTKVFRRLFALSHTHLLANRNSVVFISTLTVTLPLSLQKDIAKMSKASILSLSLLISITLFVIFRFNKMSKQVGTDDDGFTFFGDDISSTISAISIIVCCYICHHSSFLLYGSLENPTQLKWDKVTHFSVGISCLIVVIFGTAGYATFKFLSEGDLLENYCQSDDLANIARLAFAATISLTYPIECLVVREVLENVFWPCKDLLTPRHNVMLTLSIVSITFVLSTLTDCLGVVLELNGIATALPLAFILPSLCYLKLETGRMTGRKKLYATLLAIFGTTVTIVGTLKVLSNMFHGHQSSNCSHGHELDYCLTNKTLKAITKSSLTTRTSPLNATVSEIVTKTVTIGKTLL